MSFTIEMVLDWFHLPVGLISFHNGDGFRLALPANDGDDSGVISPTGGKKVGGLVSPPKYGNNGQVNRATILLVVWCAVSMVWHVAHVGMACTMLLALLVNGHI